MERASGLTSMPYSYSHAQTTIFARRRPGPRGLLIAGLLVLTACAGRTPHAASPDTPPTHTVPTGAGAPDKGVFEARPTPQTPPVQVRRKSRTRPQIHAASLIGMDALTVEKTLGPPQFVRHDLQAQIWQYASATCILDLFLYPPPSTEKKTVKSPPDSPAHRNVLHIESHTRQGAPISEDSCLRTLEPDAG